MSSGDEKIVSLGARRFHAAAHPSDVSPRGALEAALDWFDNEATPPSHIIVLIGRDFGIAEGTGTHFFQAGEYRYLAQMGLLTESIYRLRASSEQ